MNDYWKSYWDRHAATADDGDRFRQVLRVKDKVPQSMASFERMLDHVLARMRLDPDQSKVLDLCCGNGLISHALANRARSVTAVDFCEQLIACLEKEKRHNLECFVGDVNAVDFGAQSFDRILCAAALQHFSLPEVVRLFLRTSGWLASDGVLLLTDILDLDRQWHFFDSPEREKAYFDHLSRDEPVLGTWFHREWLMKLAKYAGFSKVEVLEQPPDFIYAHYRFDLLCEK